MASDSEKQLRINIITANSSENGGAAGAAAGIHQVTDETKKASAAESDHKSTLAGVNLETGEQRRLLGELDRAFPGVVEGLRAMTGPLGMFGAALAVFDLARTKLAEWNKELDEAAERMATHYGNLAEAIADANRKIAESSREAASALHEIEAAQKAVNEQSEAAIATLQRHEQAQIALTDAQEAYDLAVIRAAEKAKEITPEQAAQAEANIKHSAELRKNAIQNAAESGTVNQKQNELDNADLARHRTQEIVDKFGPTEAERLARLNPEKGIPAQIGGLTKDLADKDAEIAKQKKEVAKREEFVTINQGPLAPSGALENVTKQRDDAQAKLDELERQKEIISAVILSQTKEKEKAEEEQKNYEAAKAALKEMGGQVHKLTEEVSTLRTKATEDASLRSRLADIHGATQNVTAGLPLPKPGDIGGFPAEIQSLVKQYKEHLAAYNTSNISAHKDQLQALKDVKKSLDEELANIKRELGRINSRASGVPAMLNPG